MVYTIRRRHFPRSDNVDYVLRFSSTCPVSCSSTTAKVSQWWRWLRKSFGHLHSAVTWLANLHTLLCTSHNLNSFSTAGWKVQPAKSNMGALQATRSMVKVTENLTMPLTRQRPFIIILLKCRYHNDSSII